MPTPEPALTTVPAITPDCAIAVPAIRTLASAASRRLMPRGRRTSARTARSGRGAEEVTDDMTHSRKRNAGRCRRGRAVMRQVGGRRGRPSEIMKRGIPARKTSERRSALRSHLVGGRFVTVHALRSGFDAGVLIVVILVLFSTGETAGTATTQQPLDVQDLLQPLAADADRDEIVAGGDERGT